MQSLLDHGVQPGQQEVKTSTLVRLLAHAGGRDGAEGPDQVGLDTRGRFVGEYAGRS